MRGYVVVCWNLRSPISDLFPQGTHPLSREEKEEKEEELVRVFFFFEEA